MAALDNVYVVEMGQGVRVPLVGRLLADMGAHVLKIEGSARDWLAAVGLNPGSSSVLYEFLSQGKEILRRPLSDAELWDLIGQSDVLLEPESDPKMGIQALERFPHLISCALTPYGRAGTLAGVPGSDLTSQASSGILYTTGFPDALPVRAGVPVSDYAGALYAAIGVVAALRVRRRGGPGQRVDIATLDCAMSYMVAFFSRALQGLDAERVGNRHPSSAPWNEYMTRDGSFLLCTSTDQQWRRCLEVMGRQDMLDAPHLATVSKRREYVDEVDDVIAQWAKKLTTNTAVEQLEDAGLPVAEVTPLCEIMRHWADQGSRLIRKGTLQGRPVVGPLSPFESAQTSKVIEAATVLDDVPQHWGSSFRRPVPNRSPKVDPPLKGLRVIELSQYTSGPFCARILSALGAEVIKIESLDGDDMRRWSPQVGGQGYFFSLNNTDKKSVAIDLKNPQGRSLLLQLVGQSDVLLENFSEGVMERLGLGDDELHAARPDLINCSIRGFAPGGPYSSKRAFDTIVQAASGIMSVTGWSSGRPAKTGVSLSDLVGATASALSILDAIVERDRTGRGSHRFVSMFDATLWLTELYWSSDSGSDEVSPIKRGGNRHPTWTGNNVYQAEDGIVAVGAEEPAHVEGLLQVLHEEGIIARRAVLESVGATDVDEALRIWIVSHSADLVVTRLCAAGIPACRVLDMTRVIELADASGRGVLIEGEDAFGETVRLINVPINLSMTLFHVKSVVGPVGSSTGEVLTQLLKMSEDEVSALRAASAIK